MKKIWLIRHAESMAQIDETVCGINPDLSPYGEEQARQLKSRISQIESDIVLLSPLTRAWRTYQLSEYKAREAAYDQRLIESNWDIPDYYDNMPFGALPGIAREDASNVHSLHPRERASMLLDFITESSYSSYLLFGHWGIFMHIFKVFVRSCDAVMVRTAMENTSISLLEIDDEGRRTVVFWNDYSHLKK